jgi:hypothetical protein
VIAKKTKVPDIVEWLDMDKLHVHAPTEVVLLCGGQVKITAEKPQSIRDAFLRVTHNPPLNKLTFRQAEETDVYAPDSSYDNWMEFEADLAQVCQLIILFCESEGSIAELGTFAGIDEIARRLLIFLDSKNHLKQSYINHGPIKLVTDAHGGDRLFVMHLADLGLDTIDKVADINLDNLKLMLSDYIVDSIAKHRDPRTFDGVRAGHRIKLITGFIQHFGALLIEELEVILYALNINLTQRQIARYLDCAIFVEWVKKERRGQKTFFVPLQEKDAFEYALSDGSPTINKGAWRAMVRDYWSKTEPDRFSALNANPLRVAK